MRIDQFHSESRRVTPVDRQTRQDQRRKEEDRSEREQQEDAYVLNLTRGEVAKTSPFISGAYTRMGAVQPTPAADASEPSEGKPEGNSRLKKAAAKMAPSSDGRPRLDTYS